MVKAENERGSLSLFYNIGSGIFLGTLRNSINNKFSHSNYLSDLNNQ